MREFFKRLFKKKKPGEGLSRIQYDTQQDWQKRITRAKEKPKIPKIEWRGRSFPKRRVIIIAAAVGAGVGIWFGAQYYHSSLPMYSLDVARAPNDGGNVSAICAGITSPIHANYRDGTSITLVATPADGYEFVSWSGDASGISPETTITMDSDKNITARFDTIQYQLQVSPSPSEGGMVSTSGGTYDPDTTVTLVATPSPGYEFVSWSGDASGTSPETTITMDSDKNITAHFDTIAQYIDYTMKAGEISGSVISFTNTLDRGEEIQGYVELTGEYKTRDRTFRWNFEIINPEGRPEDIFRGHWVKETYHEFDLKAVYKGEYQIKVDHNSRYDLHLVIEIIPKGWQSSKPQ